MILQKVFSLATNNKRNLISYSKMFINDNNAFNITAFTSKEAFPYIIKLYDRNSIIQYAYVDPNEQKLLVSYKTTVVIKLLIK